ncbi:hypothetical protein K439DRAFT_1620701 [Ramaria rubella]|nr:hypothetical protein K439DRAFT_1620701 [Ramaria rubella]
MLLYCTVGSSRSDIVFERNHGCRCLGCWNATATDYATAMDAVVNDSTTSTDDDTATATSTAAGSATPAPAAALAGAHLSNSQEALKLNAQFCYGNHGLNPACLEDDTQPIYIYQWVPPVCYAH